MKGIKIAFKNFRRRLAGPLQIFVVSDCTDENVQARYKAAFFREWPRAIVECVNATHVLEAAGTAMDILNEMNGKHGVVFINFAPRRDVDKKKGQANGPDFVYFFLDKSLVITTVHPLIFGMFRHFGLKIGEVRSIHCDEKRFPETQFRSGKIIPIIAGEILAHAYSGEICEIHAESPGARVWFIDNFGNCKTTLTEALGKYWGRSLHLMDEFVHFQQEILAYHYGLTDVPDGVSACIYGSSGYKNIFGGELVIKGGSFAHKYGIQIGDEIVLKPR